MSDAFQQTLLAKYYRSLSILIVDDLENFRLSLRQMISSFGVGTIETASNGEDAIARCQTQRFDVLLCDYNLGPAKNGQQVLEELRYNKLINETSIFVMITAETSKDMVMGALEYLPDGYITKPITKEVLQTRLDSMITQRELLKPINEAIDSGQLDVAIQLVHREMQSHTKYMSWCLRKLASLLFAKGELEEAQKIYEDVLASRELSWAQLGLAKVQIALDNVDPAIAVLSEIIEKNPNLIEAYDLLTEAYLRKGQAKDAQNTLKAAVAISPFAMLRQKQLVDVSERLLDTETVAGCYKQMVKISANSVHESPELYLNLAANLSELCEGDDSEEGKQRAKEAIAALDKVSRKFKKDPAVIARSLLVQSRIYKGQGDESRAKSSLEQAIQQIDPETAHIDTRLELARTLYENGEPNAETMLSELAETYADNTAVMAQIEDILDGSKGRKEQTRARRLTKQGIAAFEEGRLDEAIAIFEEALLITPRHVALNLNLLQVLYKQAQEQGLSSELKQKCVQQLQNVQHIPPQHKQYKRFVFLQKKINAL